MDYNQLLTVEVLFSEGKTFNGILYILKPLKSEKFLNQYLIFPITQLNYFKEINLNGH